MAPALKDFTVYLGRYGPSPLKTASNVENENKQNKIHSSALGELTGGWCDQRKNSSKKSY